MYRLAFLLAALAVCTGCTATRYDPLLPLDILASYHQQPTRATTLPRARGQHGFVGNAWTDADLDAVRVLGIQVQVGDYADSHFTEAAGRIRGIGDAFLIQLSLHAMLRAEKRHQLHTRCAMEQVPEVI